MMSQQKTPWKDPEGSLQPLRGQVKYPHSSFKDPSGSFQEVFPCDISVQISIFVKLKEKISYKAACLDNCTWIFQRKNSSFNNFIVLNKKVFTRIVNNATMYPMSQNLWEKTGEMLSCFKKILIFFEKKCSSEIVLFLEIRGWRPRIYKKLRSLSRTIYSNSERLEQNAF